MTCAESYDARNERLDRLSDERLQHVAFERQSQVRHVRNPG
jgi:hypothetical protein